MFMNNVNIRRPSKVTSGYDHVGNRIMQHRFRSIIEVCFMISCKNGEAINESETLNTVTITTK
jgi:hypothetical protein